MNFKRTTFPGPKCISGKISREPPIGPVANLAHDRSVKTRSTKYREIMLNFDLVRDKNGQIKDLHIAAHSCHLDILATLQG